MSTLPVDEEHAQPCAVCNCDAAVTWNRDNPNLWRVFCLFNKHRTSYYTDRRSAVMAWNVNQRHKQSQGSRHG